MSENQKAETLTMISEMSEKNLIAELEHLHKNRVEFLAEEESAFYYQSVVEEAWNRGFTV